MGEIKSTLDLVMEKTRHLNLSKEEREEQKYNEIRKKLKGSLQKFQDGVLGKEQLAIEVEDLRKTYGLTINEILQSEIFDKLNLTKDNRLLFVLLEELCDFDIKALSSIFKEYQDTIQTAAQKRIKEIKESLAENRFISGSAVVPNLENDNEWRMEHKRIYNKFSEALNKEKAEITTMHQS